MPKFEITEEFIERHVSRCVDFADLQFMADKLTQAEYDAEMKSISEWAERKLAELRK